MTPLEQAIQRLHKAGYMASPSNTSPGWIVVLDPVYRSVHGMLEDAGFERRKVHSSQVEHFIEERS